MRGRYQRLRHIQTLDPERDHTEICRIITRYEFPWDYRVGFEMSVLTDLLVPSISHVLARSRNFAEAGQKRFDDTMLFEYEMKRSGPDSAHGHDAVRLLNRIHRGYGIPNEDFLYVLASQTLSPIDWISAYGWRPLSDHEIRALVQSARAQGRLMGITGIPDDYEGFRRLLADQRARRAAFDPSNPSWRSSSTGSRHRCARSCMYWYPRRSRPCSRRNCRRCSGSRHLRAGSPPSRGRPYGHVVVCCVSCPLAPIPGRTGPSRAATRMVGGSRTSARYQESTPPDPFRR